MSTFEVLFAVYGGLRNSDKNKMQAADVSIQLRSAIALNNGVVKIIDSSLGPDPARGTNKSFGACVIVNGTRRYFACDEGQTINFAQPFASDNGN